MLKIALWIVATIIVLPVLAVTVAQMLAPVVWWKTGALSFELAPKNEGVAASPDDHAVLTATYQPTRRIALITTDLFFGFWSSDTVAARAAELRQLFER